MIRRRLLSAKARWALLREGGLSPVPAGDGLLAEDDLVVRAESPVEVSPDPFEEDGDDDDLDPFEQDLVRQDVREARLHSSAPVDDGEEELPVWRVRDRSRSAAPASDRSSRGAPASAPSTPKGPSSRGISRPARRVIPVAPVPVVPAVRRGQKLPAALPGESAMPIGLPPETVAQMQERAGLFDAAARTREAGSSTSSVSAEAGTYARLQVLAERQKAAPWERDRMFSSARRVMTKARAVGAGDVEVRAVGMQAGRRFLPLLPQHGLLVPVSGSSNTSGGGRLMPIFEPAHNLRELCKQFVLLEDHLVHPPKRCPDCIRKHLLTAEALAEEAATLDKTGEFREITEWLPGRIRGIAQRFLAGADKALLAQDVRKIRKRLSKASFGAVMMDATSRFDDAESVVRLGADVLQAGQSVLFSGQDAGGSASWSLGVSRGVVVGPGETVGGYVVKSVPMVDEQGTWYAVRDPVTGVEGWRTEAYVLPVASDPEGALSEVLAGKKVPLYDETGTARSTFVFTDAHARMADLIQAVFFREMSGRFCVSKSGSNEARRDDPACLYAIPRKLALAAVVNAIYDSRLSSSAVARDLDDTQSVGLFALRDRSGVGKGMSVEARKDPVVSATHVARETLRLVVRPTSDLNALARAEVDGGDQVQFVSTWTMVLARDVLGVASESAARARAHTASRLGLDPARAAVQAAQVEASSEVSPPALAPVRVETPASPVSPLQALAPRPVAVGVLGWEELHRVARDPDRLRKLQGAWLGTPSVRSSVDTALAAEDSFLASNDVAWLSRAALAWRSVAGQTGEEWPLLRAISVSILAGDRPLVYQFFGGLLQNHPRSPFAELARRTRAELERSQPRGYLTHDERGERRVGVMVLGGAAVAAALAAAWTLGVGPTPARAG